MGRKLHFKTECRLQILKTLKKKGGEMRKVFVLSVMMLLCWGCGVSLIRFEDGPFEKRINNIIRVFWHEGTKYSFAVQEGTEVKTVTIQEVQEKIEGSNHLWRPNVKIIRDVPADKKMWAHARGVIKNNLGTKSRSYRYLEIHIHSAKDIKGASWETQWGGKPRQHESGQTHVIE